MKKTVSLILCLALILTMSLPAFASSDISSEDTRVGIIGTIMHEESCEVSSSYAPTTKGVTTGTSTVSYTENADGSYTFYQYLNDTLTDKHTTIPGSGIVERTKYNPDGTIMHYVENVSVQQNSTFSSKSTIIPDNISDRNMGYIHYYHSWSNTYYSLFVTVHEEYFEQRPYTFNKGAAQTLAGWTSTLIAVWLYFTNPQSIVSQILGWLDIAGVIDKGLNAVYTVLITRTITCNYSNQEFYGNATAPNANYPEGYLTGTYAVVNNNGQTTVITEGHTVTDWGQPTFGRLMLYQVFGMDEIPTSWSNLGN